MRALLAVGALSLASASWGCVADRPSRNGVFDENQYIRKDFPRPPGRFGDPGSWLARLRHHHQCVGAERVRRHDELLRPVRRLAEQRRPRPLRHHERQGQPAELPRDLRLDGARFHHRSPAGGHQRVGSHERRPQVPRQSRRREDELLRGEPGARLAAAPVGEAEPRTRTT